MRLRNKKTGEVFDALIRERGGGGSYSLIVCEIKSYEQSKNTLDATHFILDEYNSLAALNEEWEDYAPKEPLIEDEKIRKAVRAWAEACKIKSDDAIMITDLAPVLTRFYTSMMYSIDIKTESSLGLDEHRSYTIAELCGEEEE